MAVVQLNIEKESGLTGGRASKHYVLFYLLTVGRSPGPGFCSLTAPAWCHLLPGHTLIFHAQGSCYFSDTTWHSLRINGGRFWVALRVLMRPRVSWVSPTSHYSRLPLTLRQVSSGPSASPGTTGPCPEKLIRGQPFPDMQRHWLRSLCAHTLLRRPTWGSARVWDGALKENGCPAWTGPVVRHVIETADKSVVDSCAFLTVCVLVPPILCYRAKAI